MHKIVKVYNNKNQQLKRVIFFLKRQLMTFMWVCLFACFLVNSVGVVLSTMSCAADAVPSRSAAAFCCPRASARTAYAPFCSTTRTFWRPGVRPPVTRRKVIRPPHMLLLLQRPQFRMTAHAVERKGVPPLVRGAGRVTSERLKLRRATRPLPRRRRSPSFYTLLLNSQIVTRISLA